jgi:hypothetical protein
MRRAPRLSAAGPARRLPATVIAAGLLLGAAPAPGGALRWPLSVDGVLLSTFGEYRYDHLHAGIDISTGGATGHRVLAAAAGEIYRLKVEWRGYGRALYLRHPGGRITVYGHLERFEDQVLRLERRVARRQSEAGTRYPGDLYLDPPLRVRRGQVVGFSGESGVGLPHLHFEVRRGEDTPADPFEAGLPRPPDQRRPVLEEVVVTAASPETFIDGVWRERSYPLTRAGAWHVAAGPVRVSGPFLATLVAHDPAGPTGGRAGLPSVRLLVDGVLRYALALRAFRFDQYPQAGLIFDHRRSRLGPARYAYRLALLPGNTLATGSAAAGTGASHPGALDLPPGPHRLEIVARDSAGNASRARLCVLSGRPGVPAPAAADGAAPARPRFEPPPAPAEPRHGTAPPQGFACAAPPLSVEGGIWSADAAGFRPIPCRAAEGVCDLPAGATAPGVVRLREVRDGVPGPWGLLGTGRNGASGDRTSLAAVETWPGFLDVLVRDDAPFTPAAGLVTWPSGEPVAPAIYRDGTLAAASLSYARAAALGPLALRLSAGRPPMAGLIPDVRLVRPEEETVYRGPGFTLTIPIRGRFFPGPLAVRTERIAGDPSLPAMSDAVDLLPEGEALNERGTLAFDLRSSLLEPQALGIYRWDGVRERWAYEGGEPDRPGTALEIRFRRYGRFALLHDASPPSVTDVEPREGAVLRNRRPRIRARVEEVGEGLDFDGVSFRLDDRPLPSEFDPDRGHAQVIDPPRLAPGVHRLRVTPADLAGNTGEPLEITFTIR